MAWFGNLARVLQPGRAFYLWGGFSNCANYPGALKSCGLYFSQAIIWVKGHPVLTRKDFMGDHEWCFYGWKESAAHQFFGPNNVTDVWRVKKVSPQAMVHLTEKPVELAVRAIQYSSRPGEHVLDLFGGSGSTLIACQQTGRKEYLMELDSAYCDVIVRSSDRPAVGGVHGAEGRAGAGGRLKPFCKDHAFWRVGPQGVSFWFLVATKPAGSYISAAEAAGETTAAARWILGGRHWCPFAAAKRIPKTFQKSGQPACRRRR